MEALADTLEFDVALSVGPRYDPAKNSFETIDPTSTAFAENTNGSLHVRHVQNKQIPHESGDPSRFDLFSGIIDGFTGEPLHGTRIYQETGEVYEGGFSNYRRVGSAIVRNYSIPPSACQGDSAITSTLALAETTKTTTSAAAEPMSTEELEGSILEENATAIDLSFQHANFFGTYLNDEPSFGTLVTKSFTYRGAFKNYKPEDINGELVHCSGYRYKGEFIDGIMHGTGKEFSDKGSYEGEFALGLKHGYGTFKEGITPENDDEGDSYSFLNEKSQDAAEIQAKMDDVFANKDWGDSEDSHDPNDAQAHHPKQYTYSGFYCRGVKHGEGTEWDSDGCVFSGQFLLDKRHGFGTLKTPEGIKYEGRWETGEAIDGNGWRIVYDESDCEYVGHVINYLPDGFGVHTDGKTNQVYSGEFRRGKRHGHGILTTENGAEFSGEWEEDVQVSKKRLEETDGTLCEIAEQLRLDDKTNTKEDDKDDPGGKPDGDDSSKENADESSSKHQKQLAFLKKAMAQSIETSLHLLTEMNDHNARTSFQDTKPSHRRRSMSEDELKRAEIHTYMNGDTFLGALNPRTLQRTGYGVYVSKSSGCTYTGQFEKNLRHGYGILIVSGFGKYAGDFRHDRKHGHGTLIFENSSSYHGEFVNGLFEGKGTLCERNGAIYVGQWKAGKKHGDGFETEAEGAVYKGSFSLGCRHGNGTLLDKEGGKVLHSGTWRDGFPNGMGVKLERLHEKTFRGRETYTSRWEGSFTNGERHGYGILTTDRITCKGVWSQDEPVSGKWRLHYADGGLYSGHALVEEAEKKAHLKNRRSTVVATPDGFGTMRYANGDVYAGTWDNGVRCGSGLCEFKSTNCKWEGDWLDDRPDNAGYGQLTTADGKTYRFEPMNSGVSSIIGSTIAQNELPSLLQEVYFDDYAVTETQ